MTASLLTAVDSSNHVHLIIGSNPLAGARCARSIEVGALPKLVAPSDSSLHYGVQKRIDDGTVEWIKSSYNVPDISSLLITLGREEVDHVVDAVFITLGSGHPLSAQISSQCRKLRIPVNVADMPSLCTFTLLSTHSDGPLQIGVTTSGKGCKLSSRIRREIASSLPPNLGAAVDRLGTIRRKIWEEDHTGWDAGDLDEDTAQPHTFNKLVTPSDAEAAKTRRMRWLSQICEYWPLRRLANITDGDIDAILHAYTSSQSANPVESAAVDARARGTGRIILAGSGPGSPSMLTMATRQAINTATVILADKLVPAPILALIPRRTTVHIARKFPGNAEAAQEELLSLGLAALQSGETVLRLKQGDPYIYGRGGEEFNFFRAKGWTPTVLPGITSALSAPLFAGITATQRAVADQVLICTGTGRKGAAPNPPMYIPTQTVIFLMALHRLDALVESLVSEKELGENRWPMNTPCAVIERASCSDQRVVRSTLEHVGAAIQEVGSRPPGLLVVGKACEVLYQLDKARRWVVEDGYNGLDGLDGIDEALADVIEGKAGVETT